MGAKEINFRDSAWADVRTGVQTLAKAVKVTLGPKGRNVVINKSFGAPLITKDGVTVAKEIELANKTQNIGAQLVKEVASKTNDVAGDGTTTATVLAEAIFTHGVRQVTFGANPMELKEGIDLASKAVIEHLTNMSVPVGNDKQLISQVGSISANSDKEIGDIFAEVIGKIGSSGVITVEEGKGLNMDYDIVEGMQFDRGYISPYFVTDSANMSVVLEDCLVLVHEKKLSAFNDLLPIIEKVHEQKGKSLLIIAENIEGEALNLLTLNKINGVMNVAAVKAPGFGDRRKAMLEDIAIMTGGTAIMEDGAITLDGLNISDLGTCARVEITKDNTTLINGGGKPLDIAARCKKIKKQAKETTSDYDREKLNERLAKLSGGVATILVGASTEVEMKEKKARVDDALNATRAAVEDGILPGGGIAFIRALGALDNLSGPGDVGLGVDIIRKAIQEPIRAISRNAGIDSSVVLHKVLNSSEKNFGFNVATEEYGDLMQMGVIDPTKVVCTALRNAASISGTLLTTEAVITTKPEKASPMDPGMGGGMGGMGGMPGMM